MSWERQNYSTNNYTYSDNENQSFVKILFLPWSTLYFEHLEIVNESASKARHLYCLQKRWRPFRTCNVPYITSTLADTILNASVDNIWSHLIEHIWQFGMIPVRRCGILTLSPSVAVSNLSKMLPNLSKLIVSRCAVKCYSYQTKANSELLFLYFLRISKKLY